MNVPFIADILSDLRNNGFHLGGSRRMAEKYPDKIQIDVDTDYDFYCSNTPENRAWLETNGFTMIDAQDRTYWDALLVDMYKHDHLPIEVLIRSNVEHYKRAFESIDADTFFSSLWKSAPFRQFHDNNHRTAFRAGVCRYFDELFAKTA